MEQAAAEAQAEKIAAILLGADNDEFIASMREEIGAGRLGAPHLAKVFLLTRMISGEDVPSLHRAKNLHYCTIYTTEERVFLDETEDKAICSCNNIYRKADGKGPETVDAKA